MKGAAVTDRHRPARDRLPPAFWTFWSCLGAGSVADGISLVAMTWVASTLTDSPLLVAATGMAERLPWLVLALPLGAVVDRLPRIAVMAASLGARAVVLGVVAVLLVGGQLPIAVLIGLAFVLVVTEILAAIAGETAVPLLVGSRQLTRANGHVRSAQILGVDFLGRPIGGALLSVGTWVPFVGSAAVMAAGAVALVLVRGRVADPRPQPAPGASGRVRATDGLAVVRRSSLLRVLLLSALVLNLLYGGLLGVQVLFARQSLGLGSLGFAVLVSMSAFGGVVGSQVASRVVARIGVTRALEAALALMALCFVAVGLSGSAVVVTVLYAVASGAVALWSVTSLSIRQRQAPDGLLGRVNATFRMATFGVSAVGMLLGGLAVQLLEGPLGTADALRVPYLFTGVVYLLTLAFLSVRWRRRPHLTGTTEEPDATGVPGD